MAHFCEGFYQGQPTILAVQFRVTNETFLVLCKELPSSSLIPVLHNLASLSHMIPKLI